MCRYAMCDERRSPVQHSLSLHQTNPEQGVWRLYALHVERDLFGVVRLVRNWGKIGSNGQEKVQVFNSEDEAREALETIARAKRKRGYRDL